MSYPKLPDNSLLADTDWGLRAETLITFATANTGANTLFTVTGTVLVRLLAVCVTTLTGAGATVEVGIAGNTAKLIAQSTGTDIAANEIWYEATIDSGIEASSVLTENIISNGQDIILTIGTAGLTTGAIKFMCFWYPLSSDGNVVALKGGTIIADIVSESPSASPSASPSTSPSVSPSASPSSSPSASPSTSPSASPSSSPSSSPSASPSSSPSVSPSVSPSSSPSSSPSVSPSVSASVSVSPSVSPSVSQSLSPSPSPSVSQSVSPSVSG